jgi:hypothetical protein
MPIVQIVLRLIDDQRSLCVSEQQREHGDAALPGGKVLNRDEASFADPQLKPASTAVDVTSISARSAIAWARV